MATIQSVIADRLIADTELTGAQPENLGFTVWTRYLMAPTNWRNPEPGTTPEAFDQARGNRLKRSIVVLEGGQFGFPGRQSSDGRRWDSFPRIFYYAEAHQTGKEAILDAKLRTEILLSSWEAVIDGPQRIVFRLADELALEDAEAWPGNVVAVARWRVTGYRSYRQE